MPRDQNVGRLYGVMVPLRFPRKKGQKILGQIANVFSPGLQVGIPHIVKLGDYLLCFPVKAKLSADALLFNAVAHQIVKGVIGQNGLMDLKDGLSFERRSRVHAFNVVAQVLLCGIDGLSVAFLFGDDSSRMDAGLRNGNVGIYQMDSTDGDSRANGCAVQYHFMDIATRIFRVI
jgi:hypothetical protein